MSDRDQGNCELVSCLHHEDGYCIRTVDTDNPSTCILSDEEYRAEVERSEAIEYYETRERDRGHPPVGRLVR